MPKQKIAIISVLKPVDDTRSFEKFACSLSEYGVYDIHLFGQASQIPNADTDSVFFHPHSIRPKGIGRLLIPFDLLYKLIKLKPELIICNTHELLIVTVLNRILFGTKILYDIQENYYFNLKYQENYPRMISWVLAYFVRKKERILSPLFDYFVLAEKSYIGELGFIKNRFTVLENKVAIPPGWQKVKHKNEKIRILFSGTLTKSNGVYRAVKFMQGLAQVSDQFEFVMVGHCPDSRVQKILQSAACDFIDFKISDAPVSHAEVLQAIALSDFALVCYILNPSNHHCMPTKVYEYLGLGLTILYEEGGAWSELIKKHGAGLCLDFEKVNYPDLISVLSEQISNEQSKAVDEAIWSDEKRTLKKLIDQLIK